MAMFFFFFKIFSNHFSSFHTNKSINPKSCRSFSVTINNGSAIVSYDFKNLINHTDGDCGEDSQLPKELARLLKQESKVKITKIYTNASYTQSYNRVSIELYLFPKER